MKVIKYFFTLLIPVLISTGYLFYMFDSIEQPPVQIHFNRFLKSWNWEYQSYPTNQFTRFTLKLENSSDMDFDELGFKLKIYKLKPKGFPHCERTELVFERTIRRTEKFLKGDLYQVEIEELYDQSFDFELREGNFQIEISRL